MTLIFNKMKELIPFQTALKCKENGDFIVAENRDLDIFYLNQTAKDFYLCCDGKNSVNDILSFFVETYDASIDEVSQDIVELIRDLQWKKLINLKEVL